MERYCEICGGECLRKNGKTVCVRCGYPVKERPLSVAAPLSEAYALLRAQDFSSAQRQFLFIIAKFPSEVKSDPAFLMQNAEIGPNDFSFSPICGTI